MSYSIENTASTTKTYEADNGKRMKFAPGEKKELSTLPPEVDEENYETAAGWRIEDNTETKSGEDEDEEVNE